MGLGDEAVLARSPVWMVRDQEEMRNRIRVRLQALESQRAWLHLSDSIVTSMVVLEESQWVVVSSHPPSPALPSSSYFAVAEV